MNSKETSGKKMSFGMNVGSASILLIFVILCLVSFAVLSLVSANSDQQLTQKVLERNTAYYHACNSAEAALATLDNSLCRIYKSAADAESYFLEAGHSQSYDIPISNLQMLQVNVEILYPTHDDDPFYQITGWQVMSIE